MIRMANKTRQCLLSVWTLAILLSPNVSAQQSVEEKVITWQIYDAPPNFILSGPKKGEGFIQQLLVMVINNLPQYKHKVEVNSQNRALEKLKLGENVCHPALMINPDRKSYIHFTAPSIISPTSRLIVRADEAPADSVDLDHYLFQSKNMMALVKGRSFGDPIDHLVNHKKSRRSVVRLANEHTDAIFKLIQAKRVDATIAYPAELNYFASQLSVSPQRLKIVGINGTPSFIVASMGCAKTAWGEEVVSDLNRVIAKLSVTADYQKKMTSWFKVEADSERFQQFYKTSLLDQQGDF